MDDMMDNIGEMLGNLSDEDMKSLREAAQAMLGGGALGGENMKGNQASDNKDCQDENASQFSISPEMLAKISSMLSSMNKKDSRTDLITALKPYLSRGRQKRADDAAQMLRLMDMLPLLRDGLK